MAKLIEADMHIHTTASDGEYSPIRIYEKIKELKQIKTFAITDHDTTAGAKELKKYLEENPDNINFIPGIEISASVKPQKFKVEKSRLHILGYEIDVDNAELNELAYIRKNIDRLSVTRQLQELKRLFNITFTEEEINPIFEKNNFGRVDIAKLLMYNGHALSINDAFNKYLIQTHELVRDTLPKIYDDEAFEVIKKAGGYISLAHPISLRLELEDLKEYIKYLKKIGLDSIEVYHPHHKKEYSKELANIAYEEGLYKSGGSDYHGPIVKPKLHLGINKDNKVKKLTLCNHILNERK